MNEPKLSLRSDSRRIDEAMESVRCRASGMSRPELHDLLVAELKAHGLILPPPMVDFFLEDIMLGTGAAGKTRRVARAVLGGARFATSSARFLRAVKSHHTFPQFNIAGMREIMSNPMRHRAEVILGPGSQELLSFCANDLVSVWLDRVTPTKRRYADTGDVPAESAVDEGNLVAVFLGDDQVGVLGTKDSEAYRTLVQQAREADVTPVTLAIRSKADDGSWRLHIGLPLFPGTLDDQGVAGTQGPHSE